MLCGTYCTVNPAHGTSLVTDEQIITIFHLVLQVYCSPSLKEHLHNPVMPLLARTIQRKESILRAHGGVCAQGGVCACVCGTYCTMTTAHGTLQVMMNK